MYAPQNFLIDLEQDRLRGGVPADRFDGAIRFRSCSLPLQLWGNAATILQKKTQNVGPSRSIVATKFERGKCKEDRGSMGAEIRPRGTTNFECA
jgi:hypothetical protein